jgi:hypothetical protein
MIKITRSQPIPSHDSLLKSDAALKLDTLPWLLPIVFMIHDFEESIMMPPWMVKKPHQPGQASSTPGEPPDRPTRQLERIINRSRHG